MDINDDSRVKYFLDFKDTTPTGKVEKSFLISNNSSMPFEFQWKIRDAVIPGGEKYLKLSKYQVKIKPETGTLQPNDVWEFFVTITFDNGQLGEYRMVLR